MPHKSWVFMVGKEVANPIEPWILTLKAFTDSFRGPIQTQFNWSDPKKHSKESRELRQKHTYYFRFILDSAKTEKSIHSSHNKQASKIGSFLFFCFGLEAYQLVKLFHKYLILTQVKCCFLLQTLDMKVSLWTSVRLISSFDTSDVIAFKFVWHF